MFRSGSSTIMKHQSKRIHFMCFFQHCVSVTVFPLPSPSLIFFLGSCNHYRWFYFKKINTVLGSTRCLERKVERKEFVLFGRCPALWGGSKGSPAACLCRPDSRQIIQGTQINDKLFLALMYRGILFSFPHPP